MDIVLGLFLIYAIFQGLRKGFILELASLVGLVVGVYGAIYFSHFASDFLLKYTDWKEQTVNLTAFAITFVLIIILVTIAAQALTRVVSFAALGLLNKLLGGIFGILKMAFILSVILLFINSFENETEFLSEEKKEASTLYKPIESIAPMVLPKLIKELDNYIQDENPESEKPKTYKSQLLRFMPVFEPNQKTPYSF